ncbi:hypothetical protein FB567DRAFT_414521, partial [Paraphoma chrysanthemicola]
DVLRLLEIIGKGTQLMYLIATLLPVLQLAFLDVAGLNRQELNVICKKLTTQLNIEYIQGELNAVLISLIILVYCSTVVETKRLGKVLQYLAYYCEIATDKKKSCIVCGFTASAEKLYTATTILLLSIYA